MASRYKQIAYKAETGHEFSPAAFIDDASAIGKFPYGFSLKFKGGEITAYGRDWLATHGKIHPNLRSIVDRYMQEHGFDRLSHHSNWHNVMLNSDGDARLEFRLDGDALQGDSGVRYEALDSPRQVRRATKTWSGIAARLGFGTFLDSSLNIGNCKAVKLCTRFTKIEKKQIGQYVLETLLQNMQGEDSELYISGSDGTHMEIHPTPMRSNGGVMFQFRAANRKNLDFALAIINDTRSPTLEYKIETPAREQSESKFSLPIWSHLPILLGAFGATIGFRSNNALQGGAIGAAVGLALDGIVYGGVFAYHKIHEWQATRERAMMKRAYERLEELAREVPHLKEHAGSCAILTTKACAVGSGN